MARKAPPSGRLISMRCQLRAGSSEAGNFQKAEAHMPFHLSDDWTCAGCGCTNEQACAGGCYWVDQDKCSGCFDDSGERFAVGSEDGSQFGIELCPASETPAPHAPIFSDATTCYCARCKMGLAA
jgi:hypothetical protein